jgi:phosphoribosylanthranilate isomerase
MINGVQLKVCGLTRAEDAAAAAGIGADYLGFIFYPKSPRHLGLERYAALRAALPVGPKRVAVTVAPSPAELAQLAALGFDAFQIHFPTETPLATVNSWAETVGVARLWLAPKLPPADDVRAEWIAGAAAVLLDTFHADKFGGTGETGDWAKFRRHAEAYPRTTWILSGGLRPENVAAARAASGARFLDVNSGVESSPGVKDPAKLAALAAVLVR